MTILTPEGVRRSTAMVAGLAALATLTAALGSAMDDTVAVSTANVATADESVAEPDAPAADAVDIDRA